MGGVLRVVLLALLVLEPTLANIGYTPTRERQVGQFLLQTGKQSNGLATPTEHGKVRENFIKARSRVDSNPIFSPPSNELSPQHESPNQYSPDAALQNLKVRDMQVPWDTPDIDSNAITIPADQRTIYLGLGITFLFFTFALVVFNWIQGEMGISTQLSSGGTSSLGTGLVYMGTKAKAGVVMVIIGVIIGFSLWVLQIYLYNKFFKKRVKKNKERKEQKEEKQRTKASRENTDEPYKRTFAGNVGNEKEEDSSVLHSLKKKGYAIHTYPGDESELCKHLDQTSIARAVFRKIKVECVNDGSETAHMLGCIGRVEGTQSRYMLNYNTLRKDIDDEKQIQLRSVMIAVGATEFALVEDRGLRVVSFMHRDMAQTDSETSGATLWSALRDLDLVLEVLPDCTEDINDTNQR